MVVLELRLLEGDPLLALEVVGLERRQQRPGMHNHTRKYISARRSVGGGGGGVWGGIWGWVGWGAGCGLERDRTG